MTVTMTVTRDDVLAPQNRVELAMTTTTEATLDENEIGMIDEEEKEGAVAQGMAAIENETGDEDAARVSGTTRRSKAGMVDGVHEVREETGHQGVRVNLWHHCRPSRRWLEVERRETTTNRR